MTADLPDVDRLWDYDNPQRSEQEFRSLLSMMQASADASSIAELLTQIARAQGLQRQFDAAHRTLDEAKSLLGEDTPRPMVRYLLERGRVFNSARQPDRARPLFLDGWQLATQHRLDFYAVDTAHMLAIIAPPGEQLHWNMQALALAERSADPRARNWRGSLHNNIGWTYHGRGQYQDALKSFRSALACRQEQGRPADIRVATWCIARTLRSLERYAEALEIQRDLLRQSAESGDAGGYVHEELAECLLALGLEDAAREHASRAMAILAEDAWFVEAEGPRLQRLKTLAGADDRPGGI